MRAKKLPADVLEYFRKEGAKGGKLGGSLGGATAAARMTPAERSARAKKASDAAAKSRSLKSAARKSPSNATRKRG